MIVIVNDGQDVTETNYFESEQAKHGVLYLSWNAGAARLLLPEVSEGMLAEMKASYVIISSGPWEDDPKIDMFEILFEDHSDSPFAILLSASQTDRLIPENQQGQGIVFAVWTADGKQLELPARYRKVETIPCYESWIEH